MNIDARTLFAKEYKGENNFMTPNIIEYGQTDQYFYEISSGRGFSGETIYGVTVLSYDYKARKCAREYDLSSGGFTTLEQAKSYAERLDSTADKILGDK